MSSTLDKPSRTFPPLYKSTGDVSVDQLAFFHILEKLKTQKRTGWIDHNVPGPESISDHMYRMAVMAMCTSDATLDMSKCVMMCLAHDLAVGDITPRENISREEKQRLEAEAMHNFIHDMLHDSPAAQRIEAFWREYEDGSSPEARFVKDLDRFELASQAFEYERDHGKKNLQGFFDSSLPYLQHPEVKQWGEDLAAERERLQASQAQSS
ncbi:unnamed protein product [Somion occarium]|uniref:5'-deoxynucleotidase n=1 Tax=Somion occarium TaxID=3059160 RepID=A0ABP1E522_9APHY